MCYISQEKKNEYQSQNQKKKSNQRRITRRQKDSKKKKKSKQTWKTENRKRSRRSCHKRMKMVQKSSHFFSHKTNSKWPQIIGNSAADHWTAGRCGCGYAKEFEMLNGFFFLKIWKWTHPFLSENVFIFVYIYLYL